jgi:hypothetical protein
MKPFERYRRCAADCLKMAQSAANDGGKARLLQMAETWCHLAEMAEAQAAAKDDDCTAHHHIRQLLYVNCSRRRLIRLFETRSNSSPILTTA